jgi:lipooligosaccharide transport system permease protein
MGIGVGRLMAPGDASLPGRVGFLEFLAPGLLAAACMQTASFESTYPIHNRMVWRRNYDAITATPVRVLDLVLGELAWVGLRLFTVAIAFAAVMAAFGVGRTPLVLVAIPAAVLTGMAFSAPIVAYAATIRSGGDFNLLFRFGLTPLFLFSGVFFPITRLPKALQIVAWGTPLFHGVALVRDLTLNTVDRNTWFVHAGYLVAMVAIGVAAAARTFDRRLRA